MDSTRDKEEKLREACCYGDIDAMAELIQRGVNVNSCNAMNGWTALHWACQRGHSSAVELLLSYGADPTIVNHRNQTPGQLTSLPHIRAKLGFPDPALTPSSPTKSPTPSSPFTNGQDHHSILQQASSALESPVSPPPFPSNYRLPSPPPLLSSPPSSPSPPPLHTDDSSVVNAAASGILSSPSSSSSPPPLPSSPHKAIKSSSKSSSINHQYSTNSRVCNGLKSASSATLSANSRSSSISSCSSGKSCPSANNMKDSSDSKFGVPYVAGKYNSTDRMNGNAVMPDSGFSSAIIEQESLSSENDSHMYSLNSLSSTLVAEENKEASFSKIFTSNSPLSSVSQADSSQCVMFTDNKNIADTNLSVKNNRIDSYNNVLANLSNGAVDSKSTLSDESDDFYDNYQSSENAVGTNSESSPFLENSLENNGNLNEIISSDETKITQNESPVKILTEAVTANLISFPSTMSLNKINDNPLINNTNLEGVNCDGGTGINVSKCIKSSPQKLTLLDENTCIIDNEIDFSNCKNPNQVVQDQLESNEQSMSEVSSEILESELKISKEELKPNSMSEMCVEKQQLFTENLDAKLPGNIVQDSKAVSNDRALEEGLSKIVSKPLQIDSINLQQLLQIIRSESEKSSLCCCSKLKEKNSPIEKVDSVDKATTVSLMEDDIVIKVRIAESDDPDFIEVVVPCNTPTAAHRTYAALLQLCCNSLGVNPHHVERIRKLPNTRLRCDADVARLKEGAEIELVVRGTSGLHKNKGAGAASGFTKQPILY